MYTTPPTLEQAQTRELRSLRQYPEHWLWSVLLTSALILACLVTGLIGSRFLPGLLSVNLLIGAELGLAAGSLHRWLLWPHITPRHPWLIGRALAGVIAWLLSSSLAQRLDLLPRFGWLASGIMLGFVFGLAFGLGEIVVIGRERIRTVRWLWASSALWTLSSAISSSLLSALFSGWM